MMRRLLLGCFFVLVALGAGCFVDRSGIDGLGNGDPRNGCALPCENGGVCVGAECFCAPVDYQGPTCSEAIDDCGDVDCGNGACLDQVRDYSCNCDQGWTVDEEGRCTVEIFSCLTPNACIRGTCEDSSGVVLCECDPGFQGTNCNAPVNCGGPPNPPPNAGVGELTGTEFGDVITFYCLLGFGTDSVALACQADGTWETPDLVCEMSNCGVPQTGVFAYLSTPDGTGFGALANYWCDPGFTMIGSGTRVCQSNGQWSGTAPDCVLQGTCANDPCVFGLCAPVGTNGVFCICSDGWSGPRCTVPD